MIYASQNQIESDLQPFTMKKENRKPFEITTNKLTQEEKEWVGKLENIILEYISDPLFNMEFLGKKMGVSRRQLQRNIKKTIGVTPKIYLKEFRLSTAFRLLINKEYKSVKEVAHSVGFANRDYFSKLFKERYGQLPSKYIQSLRQQTD